MIITTGLAESRSSQQTLEDILSFAFSISPNSIPFLGNIGVSLDRASDLEDTLYLRSRQIISSLGLNGVVSVKGVEVIGSVVYIEMKQTTGREFVISLQES